MEQRAKPEPDAGKHAVLSNADIADRLANLAQLLSSEKKTLRKSGLTKKPPRESVMFLQAWMTWYAAARICWVMAAVTFTD